jgi:hypothetical protein
VRYGSAEYQRQAEEMIAFSAGLTAKPDVREPATMGGDLPQR